MTDNTKCAPGRKVESISCYSLNSLRHFAKVINTNTKHHITNIRNKSKKVLWKDIYDIMMKLYDCKTEICWLKNGMVDKLPSHIKDEVTRNTFIPFMPRSWESNKNEWLSTIDIATVLRQYEDSNADFKLFGPTPIDFDLKETDGSCKVDDLCAIDINQLLKDGIRKIGIVFNTDPHYKNGQHWISLYVDLYDDNCLMDGAGNKGKRKKSKKHTKSRIKYSRVKREYTNHKIENDMKKHNIKNITNGQLLSNDDLQNKEQNRCSGMYYFDSQGVKPSNHVVKLMENLCQQGDNCNIRFQKLYNDIQHQKKNTECGIYSIHFITNMLNGMKFKDYIKVIRDDEKMEQFRDVFYIDQRKI
jgi:hypothetical protein